MVCISFVIGLVLLVSSTGAATVPGTSVHMAPPRGFVAAERFPGFINQKEKASIFITELPGAFEEVSRGFGDREEMKSQNMTLIDRSAITVDGRKAVLVAAGQDNGGVAYKKLILVVDRSRATTLIVAAFPDASAKRLEKPLKKAMSAVIFEKQSDPLEALPFTVTPAAPFGLAKAVGKQLILTPGGAFPVKSEKTPIMVVGLSASSALAVANKASFARKRISRTATVGQIQVEKNEPVAIGGLKGYATVAEGRGEGNGTALTVYQVILYDADGYCLIQGITPASHRERNLPLFEKMAGSFVMKKR